MHFIGRLFFPLCLCLCAEAPCVWERNRTRTEIKNRVNKSWEVERESERVKQRDKHRKKPIKIHWAIYLYKKRKRRVWILNARAFHFLFNLWWKTLGTTSNFFKNQNYTPTTFDFVCACVCVFNQLPVVLQIKSAHPLTASEQTPSLPFDSV